MSENEREFPVHGVIQSVSDLVDTVKKLQRDDLWVRYEHPYEYRFPFGLWFRGQAIAKWELIPSVMRRRPGDLIYDEASLVRHFQLSSQRDFLEITSTFDWLSVMQHSRLPTRLIDWSESALVGLYFAVNDDKLSIAEQDASDGAIYVLHSRGLNELAFGRPSLTVPQAIGAIIRAEMARNREYGEFLAETRHNLELMSEVIDFRKMNDILPESEAAPLDPQLSLPLAVFPARYAIRHRAQAGMFTISGGKILPAAWNATRGNMPEPIHLQRVQGAERFLRKYRIPHDKKNDIREELLFLGVNESVVYPDPDHYASYVEKFWLRQAE